MLAETSYVIGMLLEQRSNLTLRNVNVLQWGVLRAFLQCMCPTRHVKHIEKIVLYHAVFLGSTYAFKTIYESISSERGY